MESEYAKMGSLTKQGNVRKNWKRRVFCLTSNGVLNYHKDPLKQALGSIDIKQTCIGILDGHKCRCPWPASVPKENCFGIVTSARVFHVYADSSDDADAWMKALAGASTALKSQQSFDETTSTDGNAMYGNVPDATGDDGAEESDVEYEDFAKEDDEDAYTTVPATSRQAPRLPPRSQPKDAAIVDDKAAEQDANSESLYESIPAEDKDVVLNPVYGDVGNAIPATSSSPPPPPLPPPSDDVVYEDVAETRRQADALTKTAATIASEEIPDDDEIYEVVAEDDKKATTEVPSTSEEVCEDEIYEVVTEEATANGAVHLEAAATIEEVASEEIYDDVVVERENEDEIYDVVIEEATTRNGDGDDETAEDEVPSSSQKPDDVVAEVDEQETNEEIYDDVAEIVAQNAASDDDGNVAYEAVSAERDEPVAEEESLDEEDGKSPLEQQPVLDTSESPSQSSAEPVTVAATADESESTQQRKRLETLPRDLPVQPIASRESHRSVQNIGKRLRQTKSMAEPETTTTTTPLVDRSRMRSSSAKRQRLFKAGSMQTRRDEQIRHSKAMEEEAARQVAELKAIQEKIMKRRSGVGEETKKQTSSDETASAQKEEEEEGEKSSEEKQSKTEDKDSKQQSTQEATDAPGAGIAPGEQTSLKSDVDVDKREGDEDSKKKDDGDDAVAQETRVEPTESQKQNVDEMPTHKETSVRSSTKPPIKPRPPHLSSSTGGGGWAKAKVKMSAVSVVQQQLEKWEKMRVDMIDAEKKRHMRRAEEEKRRRQERIETAKREREAMEKKANEEKAQRAQKRELQTREKQQKLEQEKREQEEKERRRQEEEQERREKLKREQEKENEERRKREEEERERQRQKEEQERRDREEQQRKEQQQQQKEEQERIEQLRRDELQKKEREESERREKEEREKREQLQREQEMRKREEQEKREEQQRREQEEREKKPVSMDNASSKRDKVDGVFSGVEEDLSQLEEMMRKRKAELAKEGTPTGQSSSETKKPPPRPLSKAESPAIASEKKAYSPAASASPTNVSEAKPPAAGGKKPLFASKLPVTNSEEKPAVPAKPLASTPSSESQISQKPVEPPGRVIQEKPSSPPKPVVSVSAPEEKSAKPPAASTPSSEASDAKEPNDSSEQKPSDQTEKSSSQTVPQVQTTDNYDAPLRFSDAEIRKKKEMARKRASLLSWPSTDVPEDPLGETEGLNDDDPRLSRKLSVVATGKNAQTRALAAAKWIDKELRKLVAEMTNWGSKSVEGLYEVTFGLLFEETANIFEALSGTLKTAKKHGIVKFAGELLLQGVHDRTVITLVNDTIPESTAETYTYREFRACSIAVNKRKGKGFGKTSQQNQQNKCFICTKTVYPMEYIGVDDKALHKTCFKCLECKKLLSLGNYAAMDGKFYCKTHYERLYKKRGSYGF